LFVKRAKNRAGVAVNALFGSVLRAVATPFADEFRDVEHGGGGNLPHHHDHAGGTGGFTRHTAGFVLREDGIKNRIETWSQILSGCPSVTDRK
jgi:hypothetical protein